MRPLLPLLAALLAASEPALHFEEDASAYVGAHPERPGRMAYTFRVPGDARRLELGFVEDLRGAKVDAVAYSGRHRFPLLDEKRLAGKQLALEWKRDGVERVVVSVHHHFRRKPVVDSWRVGRLLKPTGEAPTP